MARTYAASARHVGVVDDFIDRVLSAGRLTFTLKELSDAVPTKGRALEAALRRRANAGTIARIAPRTGFFVIVPAEHRVMGCPPVEWWLDAVMGFLEAPYYVGMLSAAALHGSSHFAVMKTQVVTSAKLRPIRVGRTHIRFFQRSEAADMPVEIRQTPWGRLRVATPETVAVDLLRYPVCGIDRTTSILSDLARGIGRRRLGSALSAAADVPTAQRLGFVLDWLGRRTDADVVHDWLDGRDRRHVPLEPGSRIVACAPTDLRWGVRGAMPEGIFA